jgi:hypothetical protein
MNRTREVVALLLLGGAVLTGCEASDGTGPRSGRDPRELTGQYAWVLESFDQTPPRGHPVVELEWVIPSRYDDEVFRVYSRRSSASFYSLIATVTSCSGGVCRYQDTNVTGGQSYDYYVATYDDRSGAELGTSLAVQVQVPVRPNLPSPSNLTTVALDDAVFLRWDATGAVRYMVLAQENNGTVFLIGETDGLSYFDSRAQNGNAYRYFVASVDGFGHVGTPSQSAPTYPRPDYFSEVVYVHADNPAASGFRFVTSGSQDPIVGGGSPNAQWRLEAVNGTFRIMPLGQTAITSGRFTTALTCGPGSEANCVDIRTAPPATEFGATPVVVQTGYTHVLRVVGSDNRTHFAKLRVQGTSVDSQGRRLMVFDWAYQLRPDEPSLSVVPEGRL